MGLVLIVLTIISALAMIVGVAWWLAWSGKTSRRSGPAVGAELMQDAGEDRGGLGARVVDRSVFVGKAVAVEREAGVSYGEVKQMLRGRQWRAVLPPLLAMVGLYGFIVFGALALWVALDDKLIASLVSGIALLTMARIAYDFARA